jgi:arsenate reductase
MKARISLFAALPVAKLDRMALTSKLRDIGQGEGASSPRRDAS